jgi:hypothetical protein
MQLAGASVRLRGNGLRPFVKRPKLEARAVLSPNTF